MTKDISQNTSPSFFCSNILANTLDPVVAINEEGERALFEAHQRLDALMRALPVESASRMTLPARASRETQRS